MCVCVTNGQKYGAVQLIMVQMVCFYFFGSDRQQIIVKLTSNASVLIVLWYVIFT